MTGNSDIIRIAIVAFVVFLIAAAFYLFGEQLGALLYQLGIEV